MMNRTTSRVAIGAALLTTFFLLSIESAQAQSNRMRATIPFAFYSDEGVLPAGDYDIERLGSGVAKLFNRDTHAVVVSNTISISNRTSQSVSAKLVFHRYGNDYFLKEMWWEGAADGGALLPSKAERELARTSTPVRIVSVAVR